MDWIELSGFAAGIIVALSLLPQLIKSFKSKKTKDLSMMWLLINLSSQVLWLIYGFMRNAWPLVMTSVFVSVMTFILIGLKRRYG